MEWVVRYATSSCCGCLTGQVTSATDGYTTPNDLDNNGTHDFQEAGAAANITGDPVDQDFVLGGSATFYGYI